MPHLVADLTLDIQESDLLNVLKEQTWECGCDAPHSVWVEYGTDPHRISEKGQRSIHTWCKRKLRLKGEELERVYQAVLWKIRKQGTTAHPWFRPAMLKVQGQVPQIVSKRLDRAPEFICKAIIAECSKNLTISTPNADGKMSKISDTGDLLKGLYYRRLS